MNSYTYQFQRSKQREVVSLFGRVAIGGTGAPTLASAQSIGITSITRNSAGNYTLVLQNSYARLLNISVSQLINAGSLAAPIVQIISETVATPATKNIVIQFQAADGSTETDPASGTLVYLTIDLCDVAGR